MKFKNITTKIINMKINNEWKSIKPNAFINIPEYIGNRQEGLFACEEEKKEEEKKEEEKKVEEKKVEVEESKKKQKLLKKDLLALTKDGLNDYGAQIGLTSINSKMKKSKMISEILSYQK